MDVDLIQQNLSLARMGQAKAQTEKISKADEKKQAELMQACEGFEAILLHTMIKSMRSSLPGDALLEESHGTDMYRSLYDQHLADAVSKTPAGTGIKEFLYEELKKSV